MIERAGIFLLAGVAAATLAGCGTKDPDPTPSVAPVALASAAPIATPSPASASTVTLDFGDDNGKFARDGECDDKRFTGAGMTSTPLIDSDIRHDATDCRTAFNQGRLSFKGDNASDGGSSADAAPAEVSRIQWGDNNGKYARDGECDDKRFTGPGMTSTPLLDSDIQHDASDCRTAFEQGRLTLRE
jgi:hypothetical protein